MIITCEQCRTRYNFAVDEKTPPVFKVKCTKCNHIFVVHKNKESEKPVLLPEEAIVSNDYKIIAVCNQKGGVSKTTTTLNLGMSLAMLKKRVLLVDFDMQASLTISLGLNNKAKSFYDLLHVPGNDFPDVILKTKYQNLWVLPSNPNMALLPKKNINKKDFEHLLRDKLDGIKKNVDHILIDTPPSLEFFTLNALMASDTVIIPTQCEYLSMHGVAHIVDSIDTINKMKKKKISHRILFTMFNPERTASKVIHKKIINKYKENVFSTVIEYDPKLQEAQIMNCPVAQYDQNSLSAGQYLELAKEITGAVA